MQASVGTQRERRDLRQQFLGVRRHITTTQPHVVRHLVQGLRTWLQMMRFRCVGSYAPFRGEPDISEAFVSVGSEEKLPTVALPVVTNQVEAVMQYMEVTPQTTLIRGAYGISEPAGGRFVVPEVIFSPCVAVTANGFRLGNGGGYFDRYLTRLLEQGIRPVTVAVAYEALMTTEFQPEPHDQAFDWIATETGVRRATPL